MANEPKSEHMRYAYGYTDKKPSLTWWIIQAIMVAIALYGCVEIVPMTANEADVAAANDQSGQPNDDPLSDDFTQQSAA
jgi:hypothetical protein